MKENVSPPAPTGDSVPALAIVVVWSFFAFIFFLVSTSEDCTRNMRVGFYLGGAVCSLLAVLGLGKWMLELAGVRESDSQWMPDFIANLDEEQDADEAQTDREEEHEEPGLVLRSVMTVLYYFPAILILGLGILMLYTVLGPTVLLGLAGCVAIYFIVRRIRRYRSRDCPECRMPMELLSEDDEDAHLSKSEILEEKLNSANYDVWMCRSCRRSQTVRYGAFFSRYSKCPACGAKTRSVSISVIRQPTHTISGSKEITESCDNCDYKEQYLRSISSTGS